MRALYSPRVCILNHVQRLQPLHVMHADCHAQAAPKNAVCMGRGLVREHNGTGNAWETRGKRAGDIQLTGAFEFAHALPGAFFYSLEPSIESRTFHLYGLWTARNVENGNTIENIKQFGEAGRAN